MSKLILQLEWLEFFPLRCGRRAAYARTEEAFVYLPLSGSGFRVERVGGPRPSEVALRAYPQIQDAQVTSFFLRIRARKP